MIRFADKNTRQLVRQMWETCFGDMDDYLDILFKYKYQDQNTLLYFVDDKAVASLQMLPYTITFYGEEIPLSYIAGACTLPEHRQKGYMNELLLKSFEVMRERNIPLSILIPGEEWLYEFYEKYDYEMVFDENEKPIALKQIIDSHKGDLDKSYQEYKTRYLNKDFCVQHDRQDFQAIVEDYFLDESSTKTELSGMAKIIDANYLLNLFAKKYPLKHFSVKVENKTYQIEKGKSYLIEGSATLELDSSTLCRLLFGFELDELDPCYASFFEPHEPSLSLMLE